MRLREGGGGRPKIATKVAAELEPKVELRRRPPRASDVATEPRLGELLVGQRLITARQLKAALTHQVAESLRLGAALVQLGMIGERDLVGALSLQLGVDTIDLRRELPDPEAV